MSETQLYKTAVHRVKELLLDIKKSKYEVVKIALSVCDIKQGGDQRQERYNIKRFAEDVGMKYVTLMQWMREYSNVVVKLPNEALNAHAVNRTARKVTRKTNQETVRRIYNNEKKGTHIDDLMINVKRYSKFIFNKLKEHDLSEAKLKHVIEINEYCAESNRILTDEILRRQK